MQDNATIIFNGEDEFKLKKEIKRAAKELDLNFSSFMKKLYLDWKAQQVKPTKTKT